MRLGRTRTNHVDTRTRAHGDAPQPQYHAWSSWSTAVALHLANERRATQVQTVETFVGLPQGFLQSMQRSASGECTCSSAACTARVDAIKQTAKFALGNHSYDAQGRLAAVDTAYISVAMLNCSTSRRRRRRLRASGVGVLLQINVKDADVSREVGGTNSTLQARTYSP